jgi:signal transduction histidine kinase
LAALATDVIRQAIPDEMAPPRIAALPRSSVRQELLAPVTALVGYGEMLIEKTRGRGLEDLGPDLERILRSTRELLALTDRLLDVSGAAGRRSGADLEELQPSCGTICVTR